MKYVVTLKFSVEADEVFEAQAIGQDIADFSDDEYRGRELKWLHVGAEEEYL